MRNTRWLAGFLIMAGLASPAFAAQRPTVIELFTSQGCSSCPAADELLIGLAQQDPSILPLSLHVDYWDRLGWKDPYASEANTKRQRTYKEMHRGRMYTPQMIIDGAASAIGSNLAQVSKAIAFARKEPSNVPVTLRLSADGDVLNVEIAASNDSDGAYIPETATVYAMQFTPHGTTQVKSGENRGHTIDNINNVTRITTLGNWNKKGNHFELPLKDIGSDGLAVIVQGEAQGRIIGAARYLPATK